MNLKQLRYFVTIAEEHQITAAARSLHISQPPLSHELAALEHELGVRLMTRGRHGAELTDAGRLLYDRAVRLLDMASATRHEMESFGKGCSGVLSLGCISSCGGVVPDGRMLGLARHYPDVRFEVHEANTYVLLDMLERGTINLGVVRTPFERPGLERRLKPPEPMVAVMADGSEVGADDATITIDELADAPIVMYRRFEALVRETFGKRGVSPFVACLNDDARTTCTWARRGLGVGLVPQTILRTVNVEGLVCKEILCDELTTRVALVWERERYLSPLARKFVELFEGRDGDDG